MPNQRHFFDRLLDPIQDTLTPDAAIADIRVNAAMQAHLDDLAERHHEGQLSADELAEYDGLVSAAAVISVLQAKARLVLKRQSAA
jgi:hypothetical protein